MDVKNIAHMQSALLIWNPKTTEETEKEAEKQLHTQMDVEETVVVYNTNSLTVFEKNSTLTFSFEVSTLF